MMICAPALDELCDRVRGVGIAVAPPDVDASPEVFADREPDARTLVFDDSGGAAGREVAVLVKHVVGRQQAFVVAGDLLAVTEHEQ